MPGSALQAPADLVIEQMDGEPPTLLHGLTPLGLFDISIGEQHEFSEPLTLSFSCKSEDLRADMDPADQFAAGYWDTDRQTWFLMPVQVDLDNQRMILETDHLTVYGFFNWAAGYDVKCSIELRQM